MLYLCNAYPLLMLFYAFAYVILCLCNASAMRLLALCCVYATVLEFDLHFACIVDTLRLSCSCTVHVLS